MSKTCQATNKEIHSQALSGYRTAPSGEGQGFFQEHPPTPSPPVVVARSDGDVIPYSKKKVYTDTFFFNGSNN